MQSQVRRVVTSHEADGKAVVLFDGAPVKVREQAESGVKSFLLWTTDVTPADISGSADRGDRTIGIPPPPGGSVFRIVDFHPFDDTKLPVDHMTRSIGTDHTPAKGWAPRHPAMHRTRSIDYAIVMSGEIDMLLDEFGSSSESRRRARSARDEPRLGQSRHRAVPHRLRADRRARVIIRITS